MMHDDELDSTAIAAAERINDALDAIAQGVSPAFHLHRLDDATARTIDHFQKLSSHAGAPVPAGTFVNQLREDLMLTSDSALPSVAAEPKQRVTRSGAIQRRSEMPSRRGAFETAAAVFLVCALMFGAFAAGEGPRVLNFVGMTSQETATRAVMWGGDPGRTWNLGDTDPEFGTVAQMAAQSDPQNRQAVMSALIVGDDLIRIVADSQAKLAITSVNLETQTEEWRTSVKAWGTLASDGDRLFVFTLNPKRVTRLRPRLTAFSLKTGDQLWSGPELQQGTDAANAYGPILLDGTVYAADALGNTVAVDPETGTLIWQYPRVPFPEVYSDAINGDVTTSSMIAIGDAVYISTASKTLIKLDRKSGVEIVAVNLIDRFGADIQSVSLQASGPNLLARLTRTATSGSDNGKIPPIQRTTIAMLRSADLSTVWNDDFSGVYGNIVTAPDAIIIGAQSNEPLPDTTERSKEMLLLNPTTGMTSRRLAILEQHDVPLSIVAGNVLLTLSTTSDLTAIDLSGQQQYGLPLVSPQKAAQGTTIPPLLPPLMWKNVPVIVAGDGSAWTFPKEAAPPTTPEIIPSETPAGRVPPTPGPSSSLSPNSITFTIQVYVDGVLNDDPAAIATARAELDRVLAPYANGSNCQIGFALITSRSFDVGQGVQLSDAIAKMIETDHSELLPAGADGKTTKLVRESVAIPGTTRLGEVQLQLFLNMGCQPAPATPVATPVVP